MIKREIRGFEAIFDSQFADDQQMLFFKPLFFPEEESINLLAKFLMSMMERALAYESHCIIFLMDKTNTPIVEIYLQFGLPFTKFVGG